MFDGLLPLTDRPAVLRKRPGASFGVRRPRVSRFPKVATPWDLTPAQCAIMPLLLEDKSHKEIGVILCMAKKTVDTHVGRVKAAMGVRSLVQAAVQWDRWTRPGGQPPEPAEGVLVLRWRGGQQSVLLSDER